MLGAITTTIRPDAAPDAIVTVMDVLLHELIVIGAPFTVTWLLPCEAPKWVPLITTWLPIEPVVADTPVITGAGDAAESRDTLSNVAVCRLLFVPLSTNSPMYAFSAMLIVALAICVQFCPSPDS